MGFPASRVGDVWRLSFEDYPGLEVRVRRPGFSAQLLLDRAERALADRPDGRQKVAAVRDLLTALADSILSWTLEDERGRTLPSTRRAVLAQNEALLMEIFGAWRREVLTARRKPPADPVAELRAAEQQLQDLPMEALPDAEAPEEAGVALSLDPQVAAAQRQAWEQAARPEMPLWRGPELVEGVSDIA